MNEDKKINVLWISDLVTPTGFSRVAHGVLEFLPKEKYNIFGIGVNYRGDPHNLNIPVFPAVLGGDVYGYGRMKDIFNSYRIDMVFILNDVWVIHQYLQMMKEIFPEKDGKRRIPKVVVYFPVDAKEHSAGWYSNFDIVSKAFTYTQFGKQVAQLARPDYDFGIIPHGVNTKTFYKIYKNRSEAKKVLFSSTGKKSLMGDESFIFLNANRNQPRKRLEITMEAFKMFSDGKPDGVSLYMHCGNVDAKHINVRELAIRLDIDERLIVSGNVTGIQSVSDDRLNLFYNATDVGLNTSLGEGWGLPNMEHAVTGAPQIVPNHSACGELYQDCGIVVPTSQDLMLDGGAMTVGKLVLPEDVAEAMEKIYTDRSLLKELSRKSVEKFSSKEYSWEAISNTWDKVFTEVV